MFDHGRIRLPTVTDFGLADTDTEVRTLAVPCCLIEHPGGRLLRDAGLPASFAGGEWVDGEHDVFGDGRIVVIPAPGHTPGHQVLYLEREETGPLVLSGDRYHFPASRELRAVPRFDTDAEATRASMDRIEAPLVERDATLRIQHELARFETLRTAPDGYP